MYSSCLLSIVCWKNALRFTFPWLGVSSVSSDAAFMASQLAAAAGCPRGCRSQNGARFDSPSLLSSQFVASNLVYVHKYGHGSVWVLVVDGL